MRCNNCGWENPDGTQTCVKCGATLGGGMPVVNNNSQVAPAGGYGKTIIEAGGQVSVQPYVPTVPENAQQPVPQAMPVREYERPKVGSGTVNPYAQKIILAPECQLTPLPRIDEKDAPKTSTFSSENGAVLLNREAVDANNPTITSKVQAELTCIDGEWFICDKSAQQTTYVRATKSVALTDGDIILLGDRRFVFTKKKD